MKAIFRNCICGALLGMKALTQVLSQQLRGESQVTSHQSRLKTQMAIIRLKYKAGVYFFLFLELM